MLQILEQVLIESDWNLKTKQFKVFDVSMFGINRIRLEFKVHDH